MSSTSLDRATVERVSHGLIRVMKLMQALRQHAPRIHPAVDTAAYPVLFHLAAEPKRVSVLAECVHSDVSTVSRQVSTLVGHGLLEKVSDPDDRRAQVVRLSDDGESLLAEIQQQRNTWFADLMHGWTEDEAEEFATHLERFVTTLEAAREEASGRRPHVPPATATTDISDTPDAGTEDD
jgi:DNA-binding MarR family transcriptional regulator